jgi:hypothetical protein
MKKLLRNSLVWSLALAAPSVVLAQNTAAKDAVYYPAASALQTETDEYTRYELLSPETASFKIYCATCLFGAMLKAQFPAHVPTPETEKPVSALVGQMTLQEKVSHSLDGESALVGNGRNIAGAMQDTNTRCGREIPLRMTRRSPRPGSSRSLQDLALLSR